MIFDKIRLNGLTVVDLLVIDAKPSDKYILKTADGLGPPEVDVRIADTLNAGGIYMGRRPQSREIVLTLGLNPDFGSNETASDLRETLYGMLTPGSTDNITVQIISEESIVMQTTAYVSKVEINPFSKDPEVQLTLPCLQQYWQAPNLLYVTLGNKVNPDWTNEGTAPAGIHVEVVFTQAVTYFKMTLGSVKMEVDHLFLIGDRLIFDTRPGSRGVWLVRSGVTQTLIYELTSSSDWIMLHGGINSFIFNTSLSNAFNWGDVYYLPQYWGI